MPKRRRIRSGAEWERRYGYCRAVATADRVVVAGTAPVRAGGAVDPDPGAQARRCCEIISAALADLGCSCADVIRTRMFITDRAVADAVGLVHDEFFGAAEPVTSMVIVAGLLDPRWLVEIEAEAEVASKSLGSANN